MYREDEIKDLVIERKRIPMLNKLMTFKESYGEAIFETTGWLFVLGITILLFGFVFWLASVWYSSSKPQVCHDTMILAGQNAGAVACPHSDHLLLVDMHPNGGLCWCKNNPEHRIIRQGP